MNRKQKLDHVEYILGELYVQLRSRRETLVVSLAVNALVNCAGMLSTLDTESPGRKTPSTCGWRVVKSRKFRRAPGAVYESGRFEVPK